MKWTKTKNQRPCVGDPLEFKLKTGVIHEGLYAADCGYNPGGGWYSNFFENWDDEIFFDEEVEEWRYLEE